MNNPPVPPTSDPLSDSDAVEASTSVSPPEEVVANITSEAIAVSHTHLERRAGRYRWVICALLFFATTISYIDRQVFGILAPEMKKIFSWTDTNYTDIVFW